jgi:hypothetical protein
MRKEYDFSKGVRWSTVMARRSRKSSSARSGGGVADRTDDPPLTSSQMREIRRRVADLNNPVRYILASRMTPRFILYYDVTDGTYVLNNPQEATLFKRRDAAESVKRVLGGRMRVVTCKTKRLNGRRVLILPDAFRPKKRS